MKTSTFSNASNDRRAASKAIVDGTAPGANFEIERVGAKGARDARYAVVWGKPAEPSKTAVAPVNAAKPKRSRKSQAAAPAGEVVPTGNKGRPPPKDVELDAAAAAGFMPEKPIVTSQANIRGQKRFDYLAERAAVGDWAAVKAYAINSNNTQAKQLQRYRARLLAYYEGTEAGATA